MAKVIKMPVLGNSVEEVRILQWFKQEGDTVTEGEALAEVETDKTSMEFESPESGVLHKILVPADSYVAVEAPVAIVGVAGEPVDTLLEPLKPLKPLESVASPSAPAPILSPRAQRAADELGVEIGLLSGRGTGPGGRVQEKDVQLLHAELQAAPAVLLSDVAGRGPKASPLARAVASNAGIDLSGVEGSGSGGRITAQDVRSTLPPPASPAPTTTAGTRTVTLSGLRKRVADTLLRSVRNSPHVTLNLQAEMTELMRLRTELLPPVEKATGVRLSPTDIIVKACAVALREFSYMNSHIDGDTITIFEEVHIGLAVSLGEEGLIVPVIRNVEQKGLGMLAKDRSELAARARAGQLKSNDITGGTFTVTNLGSYGIESFNPIIPPPQVAILGVGAIQDTVVAREGQAVVRPMMGLSLSFDHRAIDGAPAAAFLARLKEILESPYLLLL